MISGGNNFNDFPEIIPTSEIATKIEKTFLVFSSVSAGLFLEWAQCCSIDSTHLNPALIGLTGRDAVWDTYSAGPKNVLILGEGPEFLRGRGNIGALSRPIV